MELELKVFLNHILAFAYGYKTWSPFLLASLSKFSYTYMEHTSFFSSQ